MSRRPALGFEAGAFAGLRCHCVKYRIHRGTMRSIGSSTTRRNRVRHNVSRPRDGCRTRRHWRASSILRHGFLAGREGSRRQGDQRHAAPLIFASFPRRPPSLALWECVCVCVCPETRGLGWPCRSTMITCCGATEGGEGLGQGRQQCFPAARSSVPCPALISRHHIAPI